MSEVVFHRLDHPAVMTRLRAYVEAELVPRPEVGRVVLIGSLARGDFTRRSDADLVLLVDHCDERGPFRGAAYAPRTNLGVPVDVLVYTHDEARHWRRRFRAEVDRGVVLHARAEVDRDGEAKRRGGPPPSSGQSI